MISRKDNLLVRPWIERRYENHRRKVLSALPAIDNRPPKTREHVEVKLKKRQREYERCRKIEHENLLLLRKLSHTMRTNRVDNYWTTPQPNFLNRLSLYDIVPTEEHIDIDFSHEDLKIHSTSRKEKCLACTPQYQEILKIPEERVPWEPAKVSHRRIRSKSVPVRKPEDLSIIKEEKFNEKSSDDDVLRPKTGVQRHKSHKIDTEIIKDNIYSKTPQRIVLSRGCLKLAVDFPSDTLIKFQEGKTEKIIKQGLCACYNNNNSKVTKCF